MKLVFASNNAHKLEEVRKIMPAGVEVLSLSEIGFHDEIEETGSTLEENSRIKAAVVAAFIGERLKVKGERIDGVFADDTGLEIDALGGEPGVYTARWYLAFDNRCAKVDTAPLNRQATDVSALPTNIKFAGTPLSDEMMIFKANRAKALRELEGKENRNCQFRTVITLLKPSDVSHQMSEIQVEGIVRGRIAEQEFGEGGFGYDPVFIPEGYDKTFGELPAEVKNEISHRARALQKLVTALDIKDEK